MSDNHHEKSAIFRFCMKVGLAANGIMLLFYLPLLFSPILSKGNYGASRLFILIACLIPTLTFVLDIAMVYMRANLMNQLFSKVSVIYTVLFSFFQILFAFLFSLTGAFVGRYVALILTVCMCVAFLKREHVLLPPEEALSRETRIKILRYGLGTMITNALSLIMPYNETLVVNLVLEDLTTTAYYKAASMIPSNLQYIATSVVVFIYPYFARHTNDGPWIRKNFLRVILSMMGIMIPIITLGFFISPPLIRIIYGKAYAPAITIMRPMWIAFGINAILRVPLGNILAALGELRFNIILSAFMSALHLGLDYYFISRLGIGGAAFALMIVYSISGFLSLIYILYGCREKWNCPLL
jgi:O-antigen/teichoic acid export membrane protein